MEGDRMPELAMIVIVERVFFHCGKCIARSNLWNYSGDAEPAATLSPIAPAL